MKIAVYTIAKNEEQFVERWAESCKDADYRLILDTGSTDKTREFAIKNNVVLVHKEFNPWRFDHARNYALELIPEDIDICIALDMDEVLQPNWRTNLESISADITRPRYKYVWSWNDDGSEGLVYGGDKIHGRHGYVWKHPVHEVIKPIDDEFQSWVDGLEIHHHPDSSKSRSQYFDLLKLAVAEDPNDDRNQFYLGREYFYHGMFEEAIPHFMRHLELSVWAPERCASNRYLAKCDSVSAEKYLWRAVAEDASRREVWVELAQFYYQNNDWFRCFGCCQMAFAITNKPLDYLCEAFAWGGLPWDLASIAAFHLGMVTESADYARKALEIGGEDARISANLTYIQGFLGNERLISDE